jgi:oxygen-independent coproporphyrinogen-3 oxidase
LYTSWIAPVQSLYIHWPFCPYKCHFCPFVALAGHDSFMQQYHEALKAEIRDFVSAGVPKVPIKTIFFGGGTPSTYPDELLLDMFGTLKEVFIFAPDIEVTLEVNPGTVRIPEQLNVWQSIGITRLSIGVQSLKESVLKNLNRHQATADVLQLIQHATDYFSNISVDLILGLPEVSVAEWKDFLQQIVQWPIQHLSLYFLTVHEDTALYFRVKKKQIVLAEDSEMVDLYHWSCDLLRTAGFEQYEMSNFAKPGYACLHNQVYWERKPYKGFGLGACSFNGTQRFENEKRLPVYLEKAATGQELTTYQETLSDKQIILERLMLGLRRKKGLLVSDVGSLLTDAQLEKFCDEIVLLKQEKLLKEENGVLQLTPQGLVVENEIVIRLL